MKALKVLPLLLVGLTAISCAPRHPSTSGVDTNTSSQQESEVESETKVETQTETQTEEVTENPELIPGVTQFDLDYIGYEGKDNYAGTRQGFKFEGVLDEFPADSWLVAGVYKPFNVSYNQQYIDFVVKIADESILKYEYKEISGNLTHTLVGLKTGTTQIKIFDTEENMIYRQTVNVRVKIANPELIFRKIATADYWKGVGYGMATGNNYRLFTETNPKNGLLNICTMSLVTAGPEAGVYKFEILANSMTELNFSVFNMFSFDVKIITNEGGIIPLKFDIAQSLSTIVVSDKQGALDMFRPIYLK